VTKKSEKRTWTNNKGSGTLFSVELLDRDGTQIVATFFKDAAEKFFDVVQLNQVFIFSNGKVMMANQKYTSIKNDYALTFDKQSEILPSEDSDEHISNLGFAFTPITDIVQFESMRTIDVCGIVQDIGSVTNVNLKSGNMKERRNITLVDDSGVQGQSILISLWSGNAKQTGYLSGQIMAIKGARVSDYNGKSLNCGEEHS
jgi:replication factor A1